MTGPDQPATGVRRDAAEFLRSRRARVTPERAGMPAGGARRRVPGLRREEVALLAGVSVDYYVRLERGLLAGVSESVLSAVAYALLHDTAERAHLFDLPRTASSRLAQAPAPRRGVRPAVQWLLDSMTGSPAYVRNARTDVLAVNALGRALYAPLFDMPGRPNLARFLFLDPAAADFFVEWDRVSRELAASLRTMAGENPHDRGLTQLVGELSTRSEVFAGLWATHDVRQHRTGTKLIRHPIAGELTLRYESMELTADPGLRLNAYVAEPGTASAERLALLASWAGTSAATASEERT